MAVAEEIQTSLQEDDKSTVGDAREATDVIPQHYGGSGFFSDVVGRGTGGEAARQAQWDADARREQVKERGIRGIGLVVINGS